MLGVDLADDADLTLATDDDAFFANAFDGRTDFHNVYLCVMREWVGPLSGDLFLGSIFCDVELKEVVFSKREDARTVVGQGDRVLEVRS